MGSRKSIASVAGLLLGAGVLALASAMPAAGSQEPFLKTAPTLSGLAQVGQTLTATEAVWSAPEWDGGFPLTSNTWGWNHCTSNCSELHCPSSSCSLIAGADAFAYKYTVTTTDVGFMIRACQGINYTTGPPPEPPPFGHYWSVTACSNPTAVVTAVPTIPPPTTPTPTTTTKPVNTVLPKIKGKAKINSKLTVSSGTWKGTARIIYRYQWKNCNAKVKKCQAIRGATKNALRISLKYKGRRLVVAVTATNVAGKATVTSKATSVIVK